MENVKQYILSRILEGDYPFHTRMPSERKFAEKLGCSQNMVHRALRALVDEGVLICRPSNGYFVAPVKLNGDAKGKKFMVFNGQMSGGGYPMALMREAKLRGCEVVFCAPDGDGVEYVEKVLADKSFSGGFFNVGVRMSGNWNRVFNRLYREHYPFVVLDAPLKVGALPSVGSNLFRIGFRAAELLYRYGKRAVVFGYKRNEYCNSLRASGFLAGCEAYQWAPPLESYIGPEDNFNIDQNVFDRVFKEYRGEFDTVFTSTGGHTIMLARYLEAHPEFVPGRDFNWLGADSQMCLPNQNYLIDVVAQQFDLLAAAAFDVMEKAMAQRGSGIISSVYVDALYHSGNTINRNLNPQPKGE